MQYYLSAPYHRHPYEHLNYIIEGHGALVTESGEEHIAGLDRNIFITEINNDNVLQARSHPWPRPGCEAG